MDARSQLPPDWVLALSEILREPPVLLVRVMFCGGGDVPALGENPRLLLSREKCCAAAPDASTTRSVKSNRGVHNRRIQNSSVPKTIP